ncbi:14724_t:CDS:2, partial [Entrophospora sp. SA101]
MSLQVKEILCHETSKYQDVLIFKSETYGNVLVLDGVIQCTERDEFAYQELITHIPMTCHPNPKKVLVIGGGDGGVIREIVKHDSVEEVTLCEIDEAVIRLSKKYLPDMAVGFSHPRVTIHIGDGFPYLKDKQNTFDVIITDSSDPVAESLFQAEYFGLLKNALRECQWLHLPLISEVQGYCRSVFKVVDYAFTTIPTYPSGQIGFILCGRDDNVDFRKPIRTWSEEEEAKLFKYYNSEIHKAAFVLPQFTKNFLKSADNKKEFSTKNNEHDPDCKDRFIVDSVYYDDSDAFLVYFTQESDDICDEATGYLLVCFNNIGKIASIRIASPSKHIRGIASEEPSFTLNPTYDEKRDVFKINFTDSAPMTTFKKTEVEDVELEIDNEGKLVTLLFHNASNKMSNIS